MNFKVDSRAKFGNNLRLFPKGGLLPALSFL